MILPIIIVSYNSGDLLCRCVEIVLNSSIAVKVIISDNGSSDGSISKLQEKFAGIDNLIIHLNNTNLGFAAANNTAMCYVDKNSEYVLFMNPDCLLAPDTLEQMLSNIAQRPQAAVAGALLCNTDGTEQRGGRRQMPTPWRSLMQTLYLDKIFPSSSITASGNLLGKELPKQPVYIDIVSGAFMLVRTSSIAKVGMWDEKYFLHCEDADWCMRFNQAGFKVLFVPNVKVVHSKGESSMSRPLFVEWHKHKSMCRFYKKFLYSKYPFYVSWLISCGIWLRFSIIAVLLSLRIVSYHKLMGKQ